MIDVIQNGGLPIKLWVPKDELSEDELQQLYNMAALVIAKRYGVLLPDGHLGYGMMIGGVLATDPEYIIPNCVGYDIACGMCFVSTDIKADLARAHMPEILAQIRELIPVGMTRHKEPVESDFFEPGKNNDVMHAWHHGKVELPVIDREWEKAQYQLGTLGGGK